MFITKNSKGTVIDGEFVAIHSCGKTRSTHIWQLIHDASCDVKMLSKTKLLEMLVT